MARLPNPGQDNGTWGEILNVFLTQAHNIDGSLKKEAIAAVGGVTLDTTGKVPAAQIPVSTPVTRTLTTTAYTLALADADTIIEMDTASASTVTVPTNAAVAFPIGTLIMVVQVGTAEVTISPAAGVTLHAPAGTLSTVVRYSSMSLRKRGTDEWVVDASAVAPATGATFTGQAYVSGRTYFAQQYFGNSGFTGAEGDLVLVPFVVSATQAFNALSMRLFVAGSAGSLLRLGLYSSVDEQPSALITDAGTVDGTIVTTQALNISVTLAAGLYWLGCAWQGAPSTRAQVIGTRGCVPGPGIWDRRVNDPNYVFPVMGAVTGALPTQFVESTQTHTPPRVGIRAA